MFIFVTYKNYKLCETEGFELGTVVSFVLVKLERGRWRDPIAIQKTFLIFHRIFDKVKSCALSSLERTLGFSLSGTKNIHVLIA